MYHLYSFKFYWVLSLFKDIDFTITLDANETKQRVEVVGTEGSRDVIEVKEFIIFPNTNHCYIAELRVPVCIFHIYK